MPHRTHSKNPEVGAPASLLQRPEQHDVLDLLGIGFGPASLAIAIALSDVLEERAAQGGTPFLHNVKFLERQASFGWHAGMLLPGTKMQISFIKDLATMRNPRSHFTFLNYLKVHNRLVQFCNLDTFLPLRIEFEDYLKWCAGQFSDVADYGQEVVSVKPLKVEGSPKFNCLEVTSMDTFSGTMNVHRGRKVVIAVGGRPSVPPIFPNDHPRIIHSSQYNQKIGKILPSKDEPYTVAVVGGGQSAAEVFNDLQHRFPNAKTNLVMRDTALRPSDDSPFVNEVFNPEFVDQFYTGTPDGRRTQLNANKATNYSVVRLKLLEEIYENMYQQRLQNPNPEDWHHRILPSREIVKLTDLPSDKIALHLQNKSVDGGDTLETLQADAVILATGYRRDVHNQILKECDHVNGSPDGTWAVERDYQVQLNRDLVDPDVSIYLQGCNEQTHGLSDTLLSILATRGGEIVDSVFGKAMTEADGGNSLPNGGTPVNTVMPQSTMKRHPLTTTWSAGS